MSRRTNTDSSATPSSVPGQAATVAGLEPAILILPPERDGDREALLAALAAAVVAIARRQAVEARNARDTAARPVSAVDSA